MLLEEIGNYLQANGVATQGTDIFLGYRPDSPDSLVVVYEYKGMAPERVHGPAGLSYTNPRIQVVCRDPDYATARQKADTIWKLLAAVVNTSLGGIRYLAITPLDEPFELERDANARVVIAFNAQVQKELS